MDHQRYEDCKPESLAAMIEEHTMSNGTGRFVDQMMAALAKKNQQRQQQDALRDPATGEIKARQPRGTGPVPGNKLQRKASGRGR